MFYGYVGIIGGIIFMVLFLWFGVEVIDKGRELKFKELIKIY